jgi:aspartate carbamoyltransferase catalytic subunit
MPLLKRSLLSLSNLDQKDVIKLFETADKIRTLKERNQLRLNHFDKSIAMVFFEPSTRTRASFQFAAFNLGMRVHSQFYGEATSVAKGETEIDTVLNILALKPDVMVVRYGDVDELDILLANEKTPIINAGSGRRGHPTQALGDLFTLWSENRDLKKERVLIIGDVNHSRVAASTQEVLKKFGTEYAFCGPEDWMPKNSDIKLFGLKEGLEWATVAMPLRIQWERHSDRDTSPWRDTRKYHKEFGINPDSLKNFGDGIIMSPGPINFSVEFARESLADPRCRVFQQVTNGMLVRSAVLSEILGLN